MHSAAHRNQKGDDVQICRATLKGACQQIDVDGVDVTIKFEYEFKNMNSE